MASSHPPLHSPPPDAALGSASRATTDSQSHPHSHAHRPASEPHPLVSSDESIRTLASVRSSTSTATDSSDATALSSVRYESDAEELLNEPPRRRSLTHTEYCSPPLETPPQVIPVSMAGTGMQQIDDELRRRIEQFSMQDDSREARMAQRATEGYFAAAMVPADASPPLPTPRARLAELLSIITAPASRPSSSAPNSQSPLAYAPPVPHYPLHHPQPSTSASASTSLRSPSSQSARSSLSLDGSVSSLYLLATSTSPLSSVVAHSPLAALVASDIRPSSADTFSTRSSGRPWVFDSDASSVCSVGSAGAVTATSTAAGSASSSGAEGPSKKAVASGQARAEGAADELEVYKPKTADVEFLDHRPEPPGASLDIDRSDPLQIVLRVTLPGFSLEDITVAMRRGHKVHIVADSYGENGGHFEKLVMLGPDVSTSAPRAEFDGSLLRIYIQRRPSRPATAITGAPQGALSHGYPLGVTAGPASPPSSTFSTSPDSGGDHSRRPSVASSFASIWSSDSSSTHTSPYAPLSPSLDSAVAGPSSFVDWADSSSFLPPPCTARAGPAPGQVEKRAKRLTGPEGARAAAKAAREEAAKRAKEEAKRLPKEAKGGRWLPFRKQKEQQLQSGETRAVSSAEEQAYGSSGSHSGSSSNESRGLSSSSSPNTSDPPSDEPPTKIGSLYRGGTIKASSPSYSPTSLIVSPSKDPTARALDSASTELYKAIDEDPSLSPFSPSPVDTPTFPPSPTSTPASKRPSFRANNLTLRPFERGQSFVEAAAAAAASHGGGSPSTSSDGGVTPSVERMGMRFTQAS
ncbi:HSP20-like chaperone domain protein [Rhodotorula toruloides]|uniref:HSP20-like chaperone domain protein n=1 Tax=Rhodotorula toruloides TaxID=5286 RepID=A0A511KKB2_RHOTO|nr:HSP20-like chaperone domain protein [Rhodotorula toruloides]